MSEESNLEQIKERWKHRRKALPEAAADIDRLVAEVERLRDEVFELKIYRGFGLDHGHERCVAEIKRLTEELGRAKEAEQTLEKMHALCRRYNLQAIDIGEESGLYVASAVGVEAVSQGATIEEALDNLGDVLEAYADHE